MRFRPDDVPDQPEIFLSAKHTPCIGNRLAELQQRAAYLLEACLIPIRAFECSLTLLVHLDGILQGVDLLDILRVCWIQ